jgi:hypothetical protein
MQTPLGAVGSPMTPREGWVARGPIYLLTRAGEYHIYGIDPRTQTHDFVGSFGAPMSMVRQWWFLDLEYYAGWTVLGKAMCYTKDAHSVIVQNGIVLGQTMAVITL